MSVSLDWSAPPPDPQLRESDIHVWRAFLESENFRPLRFEALLGEDERRRASRFVFPRDRDHFVSARGILRCILGQYLQRPPSAVEFVYEPAGKPRLRRRDSEPSIRFNVSHSGGLVVYALCWNREIAIDVEAIRSENGGEELVQRFFSAKELTEFRSLPLEQRHEAFFLCWTRKEAYVKARGCGLGIPLDSFDVSLTPGKREVLVSSDSERWTLRSFRPAEGYVGAIVAEGKDWDLHLWNWASTSPLAK
jgi:4'-phosphopantetheinyl transferase